MDPPSPTSSSLPSTSSTPQQDYASFEKDLDIDPPPPPLPDVSQVPKWAHDTLDVAGPMVGDPSNSRHTHAQTSGTGLLSHAILDDP